MQFYMKQAKSELKHSGHLSHEVKKLQGELKHTKSKLKDARTELVQQRGETSRTAKFLIATQHQVLQQTMAQNAQA